MNRILPMVCMVLLAMSGTVGAAAPTAAQPTTLQTAIAPQELGAALQTWAKESGIQVMYVTRIARAVKSQGAPAGLAPDEALRRILAGTGLSFRVVNDRAVSVFAPADAAEVAPADQMRMVMMIAGNNPEVPAVRQRLADDPAQVIVEGQRERPPADFAANTDLPRTVNDALPYYIFDAETINRSGAASLEEFLKQRLTMNSVSQTNSQKLETSSLLGNTSTINLRGLGADKTLILVNGRRLAAVQPTGVYEHQPDLNGIALSAIDRIEVLPSSASGIYGGTAIGGVVNVILKRDYSGGEISMRYDNTTDGESPGRSVSATFGRAMEGGRTHLHVNAGWSDRQPLLLRDRKDIYLKNMEDIQSRSPNFIYSSSNPWQGSLPNILRSGGGAAPLTLKDAYGGASFDSRVTFVPAGFAPGATPGARTAELAAALHANAGQWNLDFPLTTQSPTGLLRTLGQSPETRSLGANLRRHMSPWLELSLDLSWNENRSTTIYNPLSYTLTVPADAPTNPFTTSILVRVPDVSRYPIDSTSQSRSATFSALVRLPGGWTGLLDYSWTESSFDRTMHAVDTAARTTDLLSGVLNPLVDTLAYPLSFDKYRQTSAYGGSNRLQTLMLRASGSLPALPWGQPLLVAGLERGLGHTPVRAIQTAYAITTSNNSLTEYFERNTVTDSGYLEATVPLVKASRFAGIYGLDLQLSGRSSRTTVDAGTPSKTTFYGRTPPLVLWGLPNDNGVGPYFSEASYTSSDYTIGIKYQPVRDITLRASRATAFLPPTPDQLIPNPKTFFESEGYYGTSVLDPRFDDEPYEVDTRDGGNPGLNPQNSRSLNAGLIWEPRIKPLQGLRMSAEYYRIEQFDSIGGLNAQTIVDQETVYPGRVVRAGNGQITLVDMSYLNLYHRETEGWDMRLDYSVLTHAGRFTLNAGQSIILHLKNQYDQALPEYDAAGFPGEGGAARYKSDVTLTWEKDALIMGWTARYAGSYKQYGAVGGPVSMTEYDGEEEPYYITAQGSDTIPSQIYHDLFVRYAFRETGGLLGGTRIDVGVRNLFRTVPPLDVLYQDTFYLSPFGDNRLRSYWINLARSFN